ncbi:MAG: ABC transporter ATP-binding protein [Bryobacteraceae bacterium]
MPEPVISVSHVSVTYGAGAAASKALDDISTTFDGGEVTLLMGASGSGKSTLLSILGCLRRPDRGSISLMGRDLSHYREKDLVGIRSREIGFVFQFFRLIRSLNALENVSLGLDLAGGKTKSRLSPREALDAVGLTAKRNLRPDQLSGGERQRVAVARALVKAPRVLLADEPTAALDSSTGLQIAELIRALVREHKIATVIATHDPRLIPFGDRIIEMRDGRLVAEQRSTA